MAGMQVMQQLKRTCSPMEHRWGQRVELKIPVTLRANGGAATHGVLLNASISGALIATALDVPLFDHLVVTLPAMGPTAPGCELVASVARHAREGLGVEWRDMACEPLMSRLRAAGHEPAQLAARDCAFN
jgi:hypothetical protein